MTIYEARSWLAAQPAPRGGTVSVTDWTASQDIPWQIRALLLVRREQGRERYGVELRAHNGRDALAEQVQEAIDGLVYAAQDVIEAHQRDIVALGRAWARFWSWVRLVEVLVSHIDALNDEARDEARESA